MLGFTIFLIIVSVIPLLVSLLYARAWLNFRNLPEADLGQPNSGYVRVDGRLVHTEGQPIYTINGRPALWYRTYYWDQGISGARPSGPGRMLNESVDPLCLKQSSGTCMIYPNHMLEDCLKRSAFDVEINGTRQMRGKTITHWIQENDVVTVYGFIFPQVTAKQDQGGDNKAGEKAAGNAGPPSSKYVMRYHGEPRDWTFGYLPRSAFFGRLLIMDKKNVAGFIRGFFMSAILWLIIGVASTAITTFFAFVTFSSN